MVATGLWWTGSAMCSAALPSTLLHSEPLHRLHSANQLPRMVRSNDRRGDSAAQSEYRSPIGLLLRQFSDYATGESPKFQLGSVDDEAPGSRVEGSYKYICRELDSHLYQSTSQSFEDDQDEYIGVVAQGEFEKANFRGLFRRLDVHSDQSTRDRCVSELTKSSEAAGLVRLVLFSSYVTQRVVLTRVEAQNQADAFDIFDALNTTGEPLTALETCKPLVIQFENKQAGYLGSQSKEDWESTESALAEAYSEPGKQQIETKQMITSFALYFDGHKLPLDLTNQRRYLRRTLPTGHGSESRHRTRICWFVERDGGVSVAVLGQSSDRRSRSERSRTRRIR